MKKEAITGTLERRDGRWFVKSGLGTFALCRNLQAKPAEDMEGARVSATVEHRLVVDYHFAAEGLEN
jgi:hypothetical protein